MTKAELKQGTEAVARAEDGYKSTLTDSIVEIALSAAVVAVRDNEPCVMVLDGDPTTRGLDELPSGPFSPDFHRGLEAGVRNWVHRRAGLDLGYVEQLYSFADRGRTLTPTRQGAHVVSIGYLALTGTQTAPASQFCRWRSWYDYFPWEDWRRGKPQLLSEVIEPRLTEWASRAPASAAVAPLDRVDRVRIGFGLDGSAWDEEKVVDRYDLLCEAGLIADTRREPLTNGDAARTGGALSRMLRADHHRILATAVARLRAKIKYRPLVFELMDEEFTLFELQRTVEAILGPHLHKQNFRRLVEGAGLVETTGEIRSRTGGRPAKLFRFRREVMLERPAPGVRINVARV